MSITPFFIPGLPQLPINTDPRIEPDLRDLYNSLRNLAYQVGQYGGFESSEDSRQLITQAQYTAGPHKRRVYVETTEAVVYGNTINLYDGGGVLKARLANATDFTRPCYGICNSVAGGAIGDTIEVVLPGCYVTSIGGLTPGTRYFQTTVNGLMSNAAPAAAGNIRQALGFALEASTFFFFPNIDWTVI